MPRGTWHRTEAAGDSIAVSIGMEPPSAAECVLEQLRLLLLQDPDWRKSVVWHSGAPAECVTPRSNGRQTLMSDLPRLWFRSLDPGYLPAPKLSETRRISLMNTTSRVQRTPNTALILDSPPADSTEEDSLLAKIEINDRSTKQIMSEIEMPSRCAPILHWIDARRSSFQVSELVAKFSELTEDQHLQLIQTLTGAGLLKVLWFPKLEKPAAER